jgi:ornithine carbamoyltransferase
VGLGAPSGQVDPGAGTARSGIIRLLRHEPGSPAMTHEPVSDLYGRSFLTLRDFSADDIEELLRLAARLKAEKRERREIPRLAGRSIALIFEKDSTRTRIGFEVAAYDQGAHVTYLGPSGSHVGKKESVKDTARVLGRVYDAIEFRGFHQADAEVLATFAGVPVYNGLTDEDHPTQVLADLMTIRERVSKPLAGVALSFVGDARGNMGDELLIGAATMGMDLRIIAPLPLWPREDFLQDATERAAVSGARITVTEEIGEGVRGADVVYTDVWVSMGEPEDTWDERVALLRPYQVDAAMLAMTGNPNVKFMHCLPAFHDLETEVGRKVFERHGLTAMEVTDEVFESKASIVFDQAENRMHTIKAVLVATLKRGGMS